MPHTLVIAERIARKLHEGQTEKFTGDPYISHVERIVAAVAGDDAKAVAWLHDVLEDVAWMTPDHLRARAIPEPVIAAVCLLTREPSDEYMAYVGKIAASGNTLACAVKRADLRDHLRPSCPESLRPRYETALARLEQSHEV